MYNIQILIYIYNIYILIYTIYIIYIKKMSITKYFMSTSQSFKKLQRKSGTTCDKSKKTKNTVIAIKLVNYIRSQL